MLDLDLLLLDFDRFCRLDLGGIRLLDFDHLRLLSPSISSLIIFPPTNLRFIFRIAFFRLLALGRLPPLNCVRLRLLDLEQLRPIVLGRLRL